MAQNRQRIAKREINNGNEDETDERLKSGIVDDLTSLRQFDEADDGRQRGVLDDLDHEGDRWRD
jgi:hypothetical protein